MKSFLSLIPISAKVRKRQNRMTILCIIISVLLVTTIFSVADMFIRTKSDELQNKHGNYHIQLENISQSIGEEISSRSDVTAVGWSEAFNSDADQPYYIGEKRAALYGADNIYLNRLSNALEEGDFPQRDNEVMLSSNAKLALDVQIGDSVTIKTPAGTSDFTVAGFGSDDRKYYQGQTYLVAVYMTRTEFTSLMEQNGISSNPTCYVQFQNASKASGAITEIKEQYDLPEESISENTAIMGIAGQSNNDAVKNIYGLAAILFVLVLLAGVLMISGSMNSNVAQRTKFFGMMRCIGASRRQIIRYVRLEALNWCKTAVPIGLLSGIAVSWSICAVLHYGIGGEFQTISVTALSPAGLISGSLAGIVTVLLAAQSPAKRAAKVSPMAAVSGSSDTVHSVRHTMRLNLARPEKTLGVYYAIASKKNWFLMTASFSLSIILFFCFTAGLDFARQLVPSLRSWQPDITLTGYVNEPVLSQSLSDAVSSVSGVDHVFGSTFIKNVSASSSRPGIDHVDLTSYSDELLDCAEDSLVQGDLSEIYGDSNKVMTVSNKDNPLQAGDTIQIAGQEAVIACVVSYGLYSGEYSIICSQETFTRLTGEQNYSMIGVQLGKDASDDTVKQISDLAESNVIFADHRESNRQNRATYLATVFIVYSFLAVIAMITLFNIVNSISMSVTARIKMYGVMRAVGMDRKQLTRMIAAEAFTYSISGLVIGGSIGTALRYFLHIRLLTRYFGTPWRLPVELAATIIVFSIAAAIAAVYAPAKRIHKMEITAVISEL